MSANLAYVEMPFTTRTEDGPIIRVDILRVEVDYIPEYRGDGFCPPEDEGFDIGQVFWSDGKTPVALTSGQKDRLERILLKELHSRRDEISRDRFTD